MSRFELLVGFYGPILGLALIRLMAEFSKFVTEIVSFIILAFIS